VEDRESFFIEDTVVFLLSQADKRFDRRAKPWVKERWNAGVQEIAQIWEHFPKVRRVLRELQKYT
jgi:hypothetical protein